MSERVLLVDDEQNVLDAYRRNLRKQFDLETASCPRAALEIIESSGPFAVVVSDMQMPEMNGIELLARIRTVAPDTVRMMLTGQADLGVSMEAVNEGNVFRFLTKPCEPVALAQALTAGLHQYELICAERDLLENTLQGAVGMLTDVLSMVDPGSRALARKVEGHMARMCTALELSSWQIDLAAMLCQLGNLTLPAETSAKLGAGRVLTADEKAMVDCAPAAAARLLERIPRLEGVARMIALQDAPPPATHPIEGDDALVAAGANMVHIAVANERLVAGGRTETEALETLARLAEDDFQRTLVATLAGADDEQEWREEALAVSALRPDMVLAQQLRANNGALLLGDGEPISLALLERLRTFAAGVGVDEPVRVLVPAR